MAIPFARLGIPAPFRKSIAPSAPRTAKIAVAKGLIPTTSDVQIALLYVLAVDKDRVVAKMARTTLKEMPVSLVLSGISHSTFPKVLEFIAQFKTDPELDQRLLQLRGTPDRAAELVAARANRDLCEALVRNQERLLITPTVFVSLHGNVNCTDELLQNAEAFLRMHNSLPDTPARRPFVSPDAVDAAPAPAKKVSTGNPLDDLFGDGPSEAEDVGVDPTPVPQPVPGKVVAPSPTVSMPEPGLDMFDLDAVKTDTHLFGAFKFDFADDMDGFSWDLTQDSEAGGKKVVEEEEHQSMMKKIQDMTVGKRIKLAYMGNQQARKVLVRDPNKVICAAVVKSGRLTPGEIISFAGNKNLQDEVVRIIAENKEFLRKYPVQVALINNPKCPPAIAMRLMPYLHKRDLQQLGNNKGVSGMIFTAARKMFKDKYRK
jgi:hypothetical protein